MRTVGSRAESWRSNAQRLRLHRHVVEAQWTNLLAEEQVLDDVEVLAEGEVLEHGGDAQVVGGCRTGDRHLLGGERDRSRVGRVDAGQDLGQRRLAGPVVADEGDDLTGGDVEVDLGEGGDSAEGLGDRAQFEEIAPRPARRRPR